VSPLTDVRAEVYSELGGNSAYDATVAAQHASVRARQNPNKGLY